jgi:hypothetical protein
MTDKYRKHYRLISFAQKNMGFEPFTARDVQDEQRKQGYPVSPETEIIGVLHMSEFFRKLAKTTITIINNGGKKKRQTPTFITLGGGGKIYRGETIEYNIAIVGNNRIQVEIHRAHSRTIRKFDLTFKDAEQMGEGLRQWAEQGRKSQGGN